jgi:hypothetical protein
MLQIGCILIEFRVIQDLRLTTAMGHVKPEYSTKITDRSSENIRDQQWILYAIAGLRYNPLLQKSSSSEPRVSYNHRYVS